MRVGASEGREEGLTGRVEAVSIVAGIVILVSAPDVELLGNRRCGEEQ